MIKAARATRASEAGARVKSADRGRREGGAGPRPPADPGGPSRPARSRLRPRLPRRRTLVILLVLAVLLGGFGVWSLYGSSWLRVERVTVSGNRVLKEGEVTRAASVPVGAPLITVDKGAAQRRLRAALPRIRDVQAVRSWPHEIILKVTERRAELAMESAGKYVEVDEDGVRFATVGKRPKKVPLLVMEPERGESLRHFGAARLRREAARAAAALPDSVHRDTRTVRVSSFDDITMELTGDRTVRWGSSERGAAKATSLKALMKATRHATHFDVTVPSAPAASAS
ncbi:cell division protein FtsQ/DivIB [Streptomyces iconiensis]|uniref:Cell division protein FtsQ n=1 Tax=Streptomyces iconiensis TaxID=1384038 RepID=A0ABT7A1Y7_9ACTN|nr:FtsQ-type POTRA domain-containing protein [Streptomyces iconiensis]MDJ1135329.1 FtsQ-type POTRA domain-containing protein [Streptomyces iconiensis]